MDSNPRSSIAHLAGFAFFIALAMNMHAFFRRVAWSIAHCLLNLSERGTDHAADAARWTKKACAVVLEAHAEAVRGRAA